MTDCRLCRHASLRTVADLGQQPLANNFLTPEQLAAGAEQRFPLHARVCESCFLVQVDHGVLPAEIFDSHYAYFSSVSSTWVAHAREYATRLSQRLGLGPTSLVVEVASNDGYLLQHFQAAGIPVLGIEPSANTADAAIRKGVPTEVLFFNETTAQQLAADGVQADLAVANNVLAHVPDIHSFVRGFRHILKPAGVLTFEFPHLANLLKHVQFDTIYHEHYSYLSLWTVEKALASAGLRAFNVELLPTHGGSLRLYVAHLESEHTESDSLRALRDAELRLGLMQLGTFAGFQAKVDAVRTRFLEFLREAKSKGRRVVAYGAAAKGNTFLNYCNVTPDEIAAVFDASSEKQGKFLPGSHLPVRDPRCLKELRPDYVLILPWNLKDEIASELRYICEWDGRFVVAIPETRVFP